MTDLDWFVTEYIDTNDDTDRDKCVTALRRAIVEVMNEELEEDLRLLEGLHAEAKATWPK